jgi:electron transfer flavoprotein alpha subunit
MSGILVIAEHRRGELRPVSLELIAAAESLKTSAGGPVTVAVVGPSPDAFVAALKVSGVDEIITLAAGSGDFDPDTQAAAVSAAIAARSPSLVLIPHSVDAFGYAGVLAAQGGYGFATDVFKIESDSGAWVATRGGYGQKVNVELEFPGKAVVLLTVRAAVYKPAEGSSNPTVTALAVPSVSAHVRPGEYVEVSQADDVDMTAAEFIMSIGRGIGEEARIPQFRELADAMGATLGCSRPIADSGWLPKSRQVGQSGKTASACKLYLAMGISGAIQHLAGMKHVSTIVAVNADPGASIFSVAKYGIVGDIMEFGEELKTHF